MWFSGINEVIQYSTGNLFHQQVSRALPLKHEEAVVATDNDSKIKAEFKNAVFFNNDLQGPLREIVANKLKFVSEVQASTT